MKRPILWGMAVMHATMGMITVGLLTRLAAEL
jgi:hypothetical protein